jgi:2-dehydro-3-deoxy-L-rhamnonate dehydrogenase (NAD+)
MPRMTSPTFPSASEALKGHVVVTGGSSGLGAAVARAVDTRGGAVTVLDRRRSPDGFATEVVDLSDTSAAADAVRRAADAHGGVWAVVTAAGIDFPGRLDEVPSESWEQVVAVNLLGTVAVVRAALPYLRSAEGRIVTVASTLGHRGVSDATAYCASKFGIVGFTRALTAELRGEVGVTLLTPGGMRTRFFDGREEQYRPPDEFQLSPPDEVAEAVAFALTAPSTSAVRELVVTPPEEPSWP